MRGRDQLIAWTRQIRSAFTESGEHPTASTDGPGRDEWRALEMRVAHLEQLVEGLQDSVHRESTRQTKRIGELEARIQPGALGKALSEDARDRGL